MTRRITETEESEIALEAHQTFADAVKAILDQTETRELTPEAAITNLLQVYTTLQQEINFDAD
jgi:uncharacterized protein YgbK (DUF1537 family)